MLDRTPNTSEQEGLDDLTFALASVAGMRVDAADALPRGASADFLVNTNRGAFAVEIKSKPSTEAIWAAIGRWQVAPVAGASPMLVAQWLSPSAVDALRRAGWSWYDRSRGHLHLDPADDHVVPPTERAAEPAMRRDPLASTVGRELAAHLLVIGSQRADASYRDLAAGLNRSVSSVHAAMAALRADGLVTDDGEPIRDALFWALARAWRPRTVPLAGLPQPLMASRLGGAPDLNLFDQTRPGWALTDTRAAAAWGAPVVASGAYPPDFYVPSRRALRWAVQEFGEARTHDQREATVAVAPLAIVCALRYDATALPQPANEQFLLAHPLFVALDLAQDTARGREILDNWNPVGPESFRRAW